MASISALGSGSAATTQVAEKAAEKALTQAQAKLAKDQAAKATEATLKADAKAVTVAQKTEEKAKAAETTGSAQNGKLNVTV